jgi:hypothetical protein
MSKYLVECKCGNKLPVDVGQAGGRVTCACGVTVDVPPLRKLRHLPSAEVKREPAARRWGARQGIVAASLILLAGIVGVIVWSWATEPDVPTFDPAAYQRDIERHLAQLTPADAWNLWIEYYRPRAETGLPVFEASNRMQIEREIAHRQSLRRTLWALAGVVAVVAAATGLWPRGDQTRRHGDKETRGVR